MSVQKQWFELKDEEKTQRDFRYEIHYYLRDCYTMDELRLIDKKFLENNDLRIFHPPGDCFEMTNEWVNIIPLHETLWSLRDTLVCPLEELPTRIGSPDPFCRFLAQERLEIGR